MTEPTKNLNETYRFSRDYSLLYRLLHEGHRIAGFIDYDGFGPDKISRDVIAMRYFEEDDRFQIGSRGMGYEPYEKKITAKQFSAYCERYNIEFIPPTANIVRIEGGRKINMDIQDDLAMMPMNLTSENGAKLLLIGEFFEEVDFPNEAYCGCGECDFCVEFPDEEATTKVKVPIQWTTIKDIYNKIVEHFASKQIVHVAELVATDKLHFHPTDEQPKEDPETNVRRFRGFDNPPIIKTAEQMREEFYPGGDARAYDHDEIYLIKEYGNQFNTTREFCKTRPEMTCNCLFSPIQNEREFQERMIKRVYPNFPNDSCPWQYFNGLLMLAVGEAAYKEEVEVMNKKEEKRKDFE